MDVSLIIQLLSGALGGNLAGKLIPSANAGTLINSIAGIAGGGLGGKLLGMAGLAAAGGGMDIASILTSVAGGGIGGGIITTVIGMIKKAMSK